MADIDMSVIGERIILKLSSAGQGWSERIKQQIRDWAASGLDNDAIMAKLTKELSSGGTLFEAMMNGFRNVTGEAVDYVSIDQVHEEWQGVNRWTWVTVHDENRCDDCAERDGEAKTWEEWEAVGLPGLGATVCGWRCRCTLEPG
jgi:hypothetical protein